MKGWLGITVGDPSGIGPEVTLKALAQLPEDNFRYLLLGDSDPLQRLNRTVGLKFEPFSSYSQTGRFFVQNPGKPLPKSVEQGSREAAEAAVAALRAGAERSLRGELDGIVTAPVNKEAIIHLGKPFTGQTELLSEMAGTSRT